MNVAAVPTTLLKVVTAVTTPTFTTAVFLGSAAPVASASADEDDALSYFQKLAEE